MKSGTPYLRAIPPAKGVPGQADDSRNLDQKERSKNMKLSKIAEILGAEILSDGEEDIEIESACGSDLMSDVMAFVKENVLLLTGLVSPQVIRTAEMMDIRAVVFVRGKVPGQNILDMAREKGIAVMSTCYPMFIACGKLYSAGLTGKGVR